MIEPYCYYDRAFSMLIWKGPLDIKNTERDCGGNSGLEDVVCVTSL